MPLAATSCQTTKKTATDSSGSTARVSPPRHVPDGTTGAAESTCDSSAAMATNTDTRTQLRLAALLGIAALSTSFIDPGAERPQDTWPNLSTLRLTYSTRPMTSCVEGASSRPDRTVTELDRIEI